MKKTIKTIILAIMFAVGLLLLFSECESGELLLLTKLLFLADAILMGYLWQWWGMEKYYNKYLNEE